MSFTPPNRLTGLLLLVVLTSSSRANVYVPRGDGITIAPLRSEHISMVSEDVLVEARVVEDTSSIFVTAVYRLRNTLDQAVSSDVAFPFETRTHAAKAHDSFRVVIGEDRSLSPVDVQLVAEEDAGERDYGFTSSFVWRISWEPGETKTVRIDYQMGDPLHLGGLVTGFRINYIVRTGAYWKGPIGHALFTFRLGTRDRPGFWFSHTESQDRLDPPYSYPKNVTWKSDEEIRWEFRNWTPDEDIWAGWMRWAGFEQGVPYHLAILTPNPYGGDTVAYDDQLLEQVVDRQLRPWLDVFPRQAARDRAKLKAFVAEWLYCEILARNGDPLNAGSRKRPIVKADLVNYSREQSMLWQDRFPMHISHRDPWYRPGTGRGPGGAVLMEDLTDQARANLDFLWPYFEHVHVEEEPPETDNR